MSRKEIFSALKVITVLTATIFAFSCADNPTAPVFEGESYDDSSNGVNAVTLKITEMDNNGIVLAPKFRTVN